MMYSNWTKCQVEWLMVSSITSTVRAWQWNITICLVHPVAALKGIMFHNAVTSTIVLYCTTVHKTWQCDSGYLIPLTPTTHDRLTRLSFQLQVSPSGLLQYIGLCAIVMIQGCLARCSGEVANWVGKVKNCVWLGEDRRCVCCTHSN